MITSLFCQNLQQTFSALVPAVFFEKGGGGSRGRGDVIDVAGVRGQVNVGGAGAVDLPHTRVSLTMICGAPQAAASNGGMPKPS